jgi:hypothetical protein
MDTARKTVEAGTHAVQEQQASLEKESAKAEMKDPSNTAAQRVTAGAKAAGESAKEQYHGGMKEAKKP